MPFLIAFIGWHNSGKTTVAAQVASLLHKKGFRVGVLKSTKESGLTPDRAGSDTSRYRQAGAIRVALSAPDALIVRENEQNETRRDPVVLARFLFPDMDFVLIEGFKHARGLPKIEVRREGIGDGVTEGPISNGKSGHEVIALICDTAEEKKENLPCFRSDDSAGVARFITGLREQQFK
ncbi:MAG: molybdopterin-guanine dinucleotide biosynthesis protein B [Desulfobulbaceae bacterium]|nr:molybdopterin-guanine dinucleotide biosynthesis protein B [Desulfobulbaceae bacterium]